MMANNLREQFDEDMTNVFLNIDEFASSVIVTDRDGAQVTVKAQFDFQVGAVDEKERAVFRFKDSVQVERNYYVTFLGERWIAVDIRPDDLGMIEVRCDQPEITS
jgi:hypothetical protein